MDYNKDNKGFVCWIYNFQRTRKPWMALFLVCIGLLVGSFFCSASDPLSMIIRSILAIILLGAIIAMIEPKSFVVKLIAYIFIFLGVIFGLSYTNESKTLSLENFSFPFGLPLNEWMPAIFLPKSAEISSSLSVVGFIGFAFIGAVFLVMILSWFVYNARSSEINPI
ncbi:disulfide bond formation protein B [Campylobacter sp. RM16191]|uniref:disulfide bond formation protein B n=1 Tax=Campylobacter sp. RM16191 TaxID=1705728 RepID=UPI0014756A72|nr:disulfide bond formation protein B [Campylobacter sp. RM16191]